MKVVSIGAGRVDPHTVEICRELLKLAEAGNLDSLGYVAKVRGLDRPLFGVLGRYLSDPFQAMAAITRLWFKLTKMAEEKENQRKTS